MVYFNLETASLSTKSHITQLAAKKVGCINQFGQYCIPGENITPGATETTGLLLTRYPDGRKALVKHSEPVLAISADIGLKAFLDWLARLEGSAVILVGHYAKRFAVPDLPLFMS